MKPAQTAQDPRPGWAGESGPHSPRIHLLKRGDPPESLSFRSVGLGHCAHSCEEFMVTHGCPGCWTGTGVEGGILIFYKLPMIREEEPDHSDHSEENLSPTAPEMGFLKLEV